MKLKSLFLLLLAALLTISAPRARARAADISFEFFYDSLSPHGEWLQVGDYGYCWRPAGVDEDWAPYSDGYWTYTDAGWTWVSYEDFGGIVYHYGRWVKVEDEGWCWVPDYEWGPAWVSWRKSDDYVGWAPLPVEARWHRDRGFSTWVDTTYDISPNYYNFCRFHDFGAPVLRPVIIRRSENFVILGNTVNITNISYNTHAGCIFNGGLEFAVVNRFLPRPIPALKLVRNTNITVVNNTIINNNVRVTNFNAVQRGNQLTVFAPALVRPQQQQVVALLQPKVTKVIPQQKVTKGWGGLTAEQRDSIKTKIAKESEGRAPENAPARPVTAAELKFVPVKADPKAKVANVPRKLPAPTATPEPVAITKAPNGNPPPLATPIPGATETVKAPAGKVIAKKPGKLTTPIPTAPQEITNNPPAGTVIPGVGTPLPVTKNPGKPGRSTIVKPFNPNADDVPTTPGTVKKINPVPPADVIEKRNAAADAAKQQAAAQAAARQRMLEQNQQQQDAARQRAMEHNQQQEAVRMNKAQDAAAAKQRMLQQQNQQDQNAQIAARRRASEQQQMQDNQEQQIARERAAQAAQSKQRSLEIQQQSQANAARQQALERAQAQAAARQRMPQTQPQNVAPGTVQKVVPGKPGKRALTPEEAARLQQQQNQ